MDRAGRQAMMRGAAQEAELRLKQAIAALNTTPEVWAGHSRQTGDTAFHYDRLLERSEFELPVPIVEPVRRGSLRRVLQRFDGF